MFTRIYRGCRGAGDEKKGRQNGTEGTARRDQTSKPLTAQAGHVQVPETCPEDRWRRWSLLKDEMNDSNLQR
jgi:hypothetical protein